MRADIGTARAAGRERVLPPSTPAVLARAPRGGGPPSGVTRSRNAPQKLRSARSSPSEPAPSAVLLYRRVPPLRTAVRV